MSDSGITPVPLSDDLELAESEEKKTEVDPHIIVTNPEGDETRIPLDRPVFTFGRDESNHVCLKEKRCSRKHFVIEMAGDYFDAIDSGSTNKLRIKGRKLERRRLRDGDIIVIGKFKITYHGPTDEDHPDELLDAPLVSPGAPKEVAPQVPVEVEENKGDTIPIPDGEIPPKVEPAPPEPEPINDLVTCPECGSDMPENAPCETCGYKSLQLRAQENYVDRIAREGSVLGGLGLWALKRRKVLEQAFALEGVEWVLKVECEYCGKKHRKMNEFRVLCIPCEHCENEIPLPAHEPPSL